MLRTASVGFNLSGSYKKECIWATYNFQAIDLLAFVLIGISYAINITLCNCVKSFK